MARIWPLLFLTFFSFLRKYLRTGKSRTLVANPDRRGTKKAFDEEIRRKRGDDGSPELAFGADLVGGPELHAVDLGVLIARRRKRTPHHLVLMELHARDSREINQTHGSNSNCRRRMDGASERHSP